MFFYADYIPATEKANVGPESIKTAIKPVEWPLRAFSFALVFIRLAPCVRLYGLLWPFTGLLPCALPVCLAQRAFLHAFRFTMVT